MTRFKICGLRDARNAVAAAEAGADFLGFVFVPGVRRQLSSDQARDIIQEFRKVGPSHQPRLVGLFADQPLDDVNAAVRQCGLDVIQLCGDEPPDYWDSVDGSVIRQIKVQQHGPRKQDVDRVIRCVDEVVSRGHMALLDTYEVGARGGTGRSFDWTIAAEVAKRHDFLLAGGLRPENVGEAIVTARPWGVDVSSGVETEGVKDSAKIVAFAEQVRRAGAAS